jgi:uncharacterized membrane protein YdjX (TVP38/TMEM64 family)
MLALIVIMLVELIPLLREVLKDSKNEQLMIKYIDAYGAKGAPILIGLQALQVILTVVPAAAIQLLSGLCYGIWRGAIICIVGSVLGNFIVFSFIRQARSAFGSLFKERAKEAKPIKKLSVANLNRMKHPEYVAFFLCLIPGLPNGVLPYIFAESKVSIGRYILSIAAASVPSVLIFTWLGERLSKGDFKTAIILAAVFMVILVVVLIFKRKIMARIEGL